MRKIGLITAVFVSFGLYFWLSGEDGAERPDRPSGGGSALDTSKPQHEPRDTIRRKRLPDYAAQHGRTAYDMPQEQYRIHTPYGSYQTGRMGAAPANQLGGYRFRPLSNREKAKLEQQRSNTYPRTYPHAPSTPSYQRSAPAARPRYNASQDAYAMQPPTDYGYRFRPYDQARAERRWTGNYAAPGQYMPARPQHRDTPYAPGNEPLPWNRYEDPLRSNQHLWASRGMLP